MNDIQKQFNKILPTDFDVVRFFHCSSVYLLFVTRQSLNNIDQKKDQTLLNSAYFWNLWRTIRENWRPGLCMKCMAPVGMHIHSNVKTHVYKQRLWRGNTSPRRTFYNNYRTWCNGLIASKKTLIFVCPL